MGRSARKPSTHPEKQLTDYRRRLEAEMQADGVKPVQAPEQMRASFWPENENIEDFIAALRELRRRGGEGRG